MEPVRFESVVDRVVAWHNRHPLAERITREQVQGVGLVVLPYAWQGGELATPAAKADAAAQAAEPDAGSAPPNAEPAAAEAPATPVLPQESGPAAAAESAGSSPAEPNPRPRFAESPPLRPRRWWQRLRAPRTPMRALFSEDFVAPIAPRRIAAWAAWHGVAEPPLAADAQERVVATDPERRPREGEAVEAHLYLITAAIVAGDRRLRVLLAPRDPGHVLGPRHWSRRRGATLMSGLAALTFAAFGAGGLRAGPVAPAIAAVPQVAQAVVRSAEPAEPAVATAKEAAAEVAIASAPSAPGVAGAERPIDVEPRRGRVEMPFTKPRLAADDRQRAQVMSASLRRQGDVPSGAAKPAPQAAVKLYALVSASTRERSGSERFARQLQVLAQLRPGLLRAELMQVGNGWRAVCWPFSSAQEAERVRLALADRGLKTEVVEF